jgi:hypothetical protein
MARNDSGLEWHGLKSLLRSVGGGIKKRKKGTREKEEK